MYCTCSNKNNYEVISLCNIKSLNEKHPNFTGIPWTQISVTDILTLECNKPPIEAIQKVYIDAYISNTKIIETPKSNGANPEGMILTGKKLLIDGYLCVKIVYTSLTPCQSIHTITFNVPFCTYIVIEEDADIFTDIYCVKYCIEDVFLSLIDCKSIFQNVTLFLFALKTTPTCPNPPVPKTDCTIISGPAPIVSSNPSFQNSIIINSIEGNKLATLSFDTQNNLLLVTPYNEISEISDCTFNYFSFKLKDSSTHEVKAFAFIGTNEDSSTFAKKLNAIPFNTSDIVELDCSYPHTVTITNYPTVGNNYTLVNSLETYTIGVKSLQSYTLPENILVPTLPNPMISLSTIILKNEAYEEVLKIELNKGKFRCSCTGEIANKALGNIDYFSFTLENSKGIVKFHEKITSLEIGDTFCNNLNNLSYNEADIISLSYEDNSKVLITEYNTDISYTPLETTESFFINNNKLSPIK